MSIQIKRRLSGATGAPSALKSGQPAWNAMDNTLYLGSGDDGAGNATSIKAVGGEGAFMTMGTTQTISGAKTFQDITVPTQATGDNSQKAASTAFVKSLGYLTGNQSITLSGDASGTGTTAIAVTFPNIVTGGTFPKITFNAKGQVTGGAALVAGDLPSHTTSLLSDFNTAVAAFRLDQFAMPTADLSFNSHRLTGVADPVNPQDAATKAYVDATANGLDFKPSVRVATTANVTLSGIQTVDGVTLVANDRVLVKNQTDATQNGIYVAASGAWARSTDAVQGKLTPGAFVFTEEGTTQSDSSWVLSTNGTITVGTTSLAFTQFGASAGYTAGNGLSLAGNQFSVLTVSSARIAVSGSGIDLASGVIATPSTYRSVTVDTYGRVTAGTNPTTLAGYGITDAQGLNSNLTALSGLTGAVDTGSYFTGAGVMATYSLTSFGRSLAGSANAAAAQSTLGLASMATQAASAVAITGGSISSAVSFDDGTF